MPDLYLFADDAGGRLFGDTGNDTLLGNASNNYIEGASGNDLIFGHDGDDYLVGNDGHDRLVGGSGRNYLHGGAGNDTLVASSTLDVLTGNDGDDVYELTRVSNALSFSADGGTDTLRFVDQDLSELTFVFTSWSTGWIGNKADIEAAEDIFSTRPGAPQPGFVFSVEFTVFEFVEDQNGARVPMSQFLSYNSSGGSDVLFNDAPIVLAFGGDDLIHATAAQALIDGGEGVDTLVHWALTDADGIGLRLDGAASWGTLAGQIVLNVENVYGTTGDDTIVGNAADNRLAGGGGDDWLFGQDGNDTLESTAGDNRLFGQQGNDSFLVLNVNDALHLDGGGARDLVDHSANSFFGAGIRLDGGENWAAARGHVYVSIEDATGTGADDTIVGSAGRNRLEGEAGKDALWGGAGNDWLTGGADSDRFYFARNYDRDMITDFEAGLDQIILIGLADTVDDAMGHAVQNGSNVVFNFGGGDLLTVRDTTLAEVEGDLSIL